MDQRIKQLERECTRWQQKYNILLEKNQNDLIKIRLREKQLNETIGKLQKQKDQLKIQYEQRIKLMQEQILGLKGKNKQKPHNQTRDRSQQQPKLSDNFNEDNLKLRYQNKELNNKINQLQSQIQKIALQNNKNKNLQQIVSKNQQVQNLKKMLSKQKSYSENLRNNLIKLQQTVFRLQKQNLDHKSQVQRLKLQSADLSLKQKQQKHHNDLKQKQKQRQYQTLYSQVERLRQVLTLTNIQYKNLIHKQQLKQQLLQSKNDELNQMTQQLIDMQQKIQKYKEIQNYKIKHAQEQSRKQELQQQNMLLKEMIKSHKTMLKIKDNEIERLKEKTSQNLTQKK